jgi:hypothetical protein
VHGIYAAAAASRIGGRILPAGVASSTRRSRFAREDARSRGTYGKPRSNERIRASRLRFMTARRIASFAERESSLPEHDVLRLPDVDLLDTTMAVAVHRLVRKATAPASVPAPPRRYRRAPTVSPPAGCPSAADSARPRRCRPCRGMRRSATADCGRTSLTRHITAISSRSLRNRRSRTSGLHVYRPICRHGRRRP